MAVSVRDHVFETFSASGMIYLTLDTQLYCLRFQQHVKINIVYDKEVAAPERCNGQGLQFRCGEELRYLPKCDDMTSSSNVNIVSATVHDHLIPLSDLQFIDGNPADFDCTTGADADFDCTTGADADFDCTTGADVTSYNHIETVSSIQTAVSHEFECQNNFAAEINNGSVIDIDQEIVSETKVEEPAQKTVRTEKTIDKNAVERNTKGRKRTSKRLSNVAKKLSNSNASDILQKEKIPDRKYKGKFKKQKDPKNKDHMKQTCKEADLKIPKKQLKRSAEYESENSIKNCGNHNKTGDIITMIKDTAGRSKVPRVKKLELEKEVKCEYCLKTFRSLQEYFDHRKSERTSFRCKICSKTLPFKSHLMVHMRKHKTSGLVSLPIEELLMNCGNSETRTVTNAKDKSRQIKCDICGLTLSNIPILKTHMMIHTGEYAYKCCVCGEKTHSIAKHNNHLATHLKCGKVQCKICNISFESRSDLSRHQLSHEFRCSICDKVFPNKTSRVFHYKMSHKDDIIKCPTCGKMFSSEDELTPHLKYHRNRAKTQCTVCGLFVTRLDNHILSHNLRPEDSRMYVCDQCPKQFKQKLSFQRHLRTHSEEKPYACMECHKNFARSGGLRRHMITHTQEKPFVCDICGKACSQMGNLRIHMQIHKDSLLVQCKVCGENFSCKNSLQEHMRNIHYVGMGGDDPSRYIAAGPQDYCL